MSVGLVATGCDRLGSDVIFPDFEDVQNLSPTPTDSNLPFGIVWYRLVSFESRLESVEV